MVSSNYQKTTPQKLGAIGTGRYSCPLRRAHGRRFGAAAARPTARGWRFARGAVRRALHDRDQTPAACAIGRYVAERVRSKKELRLGDAKHERQRSTYPSA